MTRDALPPAPLELAYPLQVPVPQPQGRAILCELAPEEAPVVIRALRGVLAWSLDPSLVTGGMDGWAAADAGKLSEPLRVLREELAKGVDADAKTVARGCAGVMEWALERGAGETALLFAEAAAVAWPASARHAWMAARMYRARARYREAEAWLRRSARVAVWSQDSEAQALALNSLGTLYAQQGSFPLAIRHLKQALVLARRHRLRACEAAVSHDLLAVSIWTGNHAQAEAYAARAFSLYGPEHPTLPRLAHDVAHLWNSQGKFVLALPVLQALLPHFQVPADRLRVLASTARAAGGSGEREAFDRAWTEAWAIVELQEDQAAAVLPATLLELGYGAAGAERWEHARQALARALQAARARGEHDVEMQAEAALEMVERHERVELHPRAPSAPALQLARSFAASLARPACTS